MPTLAHLTAKLRAATHDVAHRTTSTLFRRRSFQTLASTSTTSGSLFCPKRPSSSRSAATTTTTTTITTTKATASTCGSSHGSGSGSGTPTSTLFRQCSTTMTTTGREKTKKHQTREQTKPAASSLPRPHRLCARCQKRRAAITTLERKIQDLRPGGGAAVEPGGIQRCLEVRVEAEARVRLPERTRGVVVPTAEGLLDRGNYTCTRSETRARRKVGNGRWRICGRIFVAGEKKAGGLTRLDDGDGGDEESGQPRRSSFFADHVHQDWYRKPNGVRGLE
ncbi:hypothetical protein P8C59_001567 [Phyllachora maydis]|uniref:Uncharacterized protein n=1 Tax=Phyllachora maydis TaxID=1825666 RepID=A0AAD9M9A6_9PEZI|nr:hypothetical protein P8C59_001567 [Phyllachora maydis]